MNAKKITSATDLVVTPAQANAQCRIDIDLEDDLVTRLIQSATEYAEHYQQRTLLPATWEMKLPNWFRGIELPMPQFREMVWIKYIDPNGVQQTLDSEMYEIDDTMPAASIYPAYGTCFPSIRCSRNPITIRWTAGYDNVPAATKSAILLMVSHLFENRSATTEKALSEVPLAIKDLLSMDCWSFYR